MIRSRTLKLHVRAKLSYYSAQQASNNIIPISCAGISFTAGRRFEQRIFYYIVMCQSQPMHDGHKKLYKFFSRTRYSSPRARLSCFRFRSLVPCSPLPFIWVNFGLLTWSFWDFFHFFPIPRILQMVLVNKHSKRKHREIRPTTQFNAMQTWTLSIHAADRRVGRRPFAYAHENFTMAWHGKTFSCKNGIAEGKKPGWNGMEKIFVHRATVNAKERQRACKKVLRTFLVHGTTSSNSSWHITCKILLDMISFFSL